MCFNASHWIPIGWDPIAHTIALKVMKSDAQRYRPSCDCHYSVCGADITRFLWARAIFNAMQMCVTAGLPFRMTAARGSAFSNLDVPSRVRAGRVFVSTV